MGNSPAWLQRLCLYKQRSWQVGWTTFSYKNIKTFTKVTGVRGNISTWASPINHGPQTTGNILWHNNVLIN